MKRKIELFMTLLLLLGMIVVSRKLSQLVTSEKVDTEEKENQIVVIDAGHGGIQLRHDKIRKRKVPVYPEKSIEMCNKKCYF